MFLAYFIPFHLFSLKIHISRPPAFELIGSPVSSILFVFYNAFNFTLCWKISVWCLKLLLSMKSFCWNIKSFLYFSFKIIACLWAFGNTNFYCDINIKRKLNIDLKYDSNFLLPPPSLPPSFISSFLLSFLSPSF